MLFSGLCGVCYGVPVLVGEMRERERVCVGGGVLDQKMKQRKCNPCS